MTNATVIIELCVTKVGPKTSKTIAKYQALRKSDMSSKNPGCPFHGNKSPCGVAPNIEEGLKVYPNEIN